MSFILFILIFILFIGLVIILAVAGFIRSLFSFGKRKGPLQDEQSQEFEQQAASKHKIFDKKEGEYVDFEEIKEDK